jgi:CRISPR-associated protein Csy2
LLPRIRVQAANAQSSPLTWGFPAISAFLGLMSALERKLGPGSGLHFANVGVVCHRFDAQVHDAGHGTRRWRLTRNPVQADGSTAAIVEEGRVHLEISLVFELDLASEHSSPEARQALAGRVWEALQTLRVAGGSVLPTAAWSARAAPPPVGAGGAGCRRRAAVPQADAALPARFALVLRDDLLADQLAKLRETDASATPLDAWLRCLRTDHPGRAREPTGQVTALAG